MTTSLFKYDVYQDPRDITVKAGITALSPTEVKAKVTYIQPFTCTLHSTDPGIIKTIADAVALFINLFKNKPYAYVRDTVVGKEQTFSFEKAIGYSFAVNNDTVTVNAKSLEVETYQGMLMAHGSVEIG